VTEIFNIELYNFYPLFYTFLTRFNIAYLWKHYVGHITYQSYKKWKSHIWQEKFSLYSENAVVLNVIQIIHINLLKFTGYVIHHQFNIQQLYALPTLYLCVLYLSENKQDLCLLQHKLIGFYNRDEKCLQRGTEWAFK